MLWLFVEKWKKTRYPDDFEEFQSAMRRIWKVHRPDDKLKENMDEK